MILRPGILALASKLQEAAVMSDGDKRTRLSDTLYDLFRGTGKWAYLVDVFGDDKSGDVIYSCDDDLRKAPYTIADSKCTIDTAAAKDVYPLTTYHEEAVGVTEAGRRNSSADLKQLQSIHDAAMGLGAVCKMKEAAVPQSGVMSLVESAATLETIVLREARADYPIKLIAPGKGSSAFYPAEVLKRDGPGVFKAGTHVYLNHPTAAEESARPEGDVANLAGVLTTPAEWRESDPKGPGLFARMKVFADHATTVEEKAPHVGMSIRASGIAESGVMRDGVPVLKQLTGAESVDVVTRAGAGGMILTESAGAGQTQQEDSMDAAEITKIVEAAVKAATAPLLAQVNPLQARALRGDALVEASTALRDLALPDPLKQMVIDNVLRETIPTTESGAIDTVKFREAVNVEAKRVGATFAAINPGSRVFGMGAPAPTPISAEESERHAKQAKADEDASISVFETLTGSKTAAQFAAKGRAA